MSPQWDPGGTAPGGRSGGQSPTEADGTLVLDHTFLHSPEVFYILVSCSLLTVPREQIQRKEYVSNNHCAVSQIHSDKTVSNQSNSDIRSANVSILHCLITWQYINKNCSDATAI